MAGKDPSTVFQRRMDRISAMAADIAALQQVAVKLFSVTARAFYGFFVAACLLAGLVALIRGNNGNAGTYGGTGIVLGLIWILAHVANKGSRRAVGVLREEWDAQAASGKHL